MKTTQMNMRGDERSNLGQSRITQVRAGQESFDKALGQIGVTADTAAAVELPGDKDLYAEVLLERHAEQRSA